VSLNNRISIRDTYGARGAVEVGSSPSSIGRSEATTDCILLESEKQQKQFKQTMKPPSTGVKVVTETVISESRDLDFTGSFHGLNTVADIA
jgi:hypothetical protein